MITRRRLIMAAAAILAVSCSQTETVPDAVADRLLVTGSDGSVSMVDLDGVVVEELAGPGDRVGPIQATPSPDGSSVVWTSGAAVELWTDGERITVEPDFAPFFYLWAPDGSRMLALGNDPIQPAVRAALIDRDGGTEVVVIDRPIYAQWLDETRLVMHLGSRHMAISDGGEPSIFAGGSESFLAPDVLDGRVVMVGDTPGALTASIVEVPIQVAGEGVVLADPISGAGETLVEFSNAVSFAVNPDQRRLAVLRGRRAGGFLAGELLEVGVDSGASTVVSDGPVVMYEWSRDGSRLLVVTAEVGARFRPAVWDGESLVAYPSFRPTPTLLIEYLPFWDQYERSISLWAPDGSAFVYAASEDDVTGVYVQRLDADEPERISDGRFVSWIQG